MTAYELAKMLDGHDSSYDIMSDRLEKQANEAGLVVVFGYSDEKLPPMHEECLEWEGEQLKYQISEPVLAYTDDGEMVTVRVSTMDGETSWFNSDGGEYTVTHWRKLPDEPEENANGI